MTDDVARPPQGGRLTDRLIRVAERKAQECVMSTAEYLAGILEGRFPRITADEIAAEDDDQDASTE